MEKFGDIKDPKALAMRNRSPQPAARLGSSPGP
jgi:hypothetical protein